MTVAMLNISTITCVLSSVVLCVLTWFACQVYLSIRNRRQLEFLRRSRDVLLDNCGGCCIEFDRHGCIIAVHDEIDLLHHVIDSKYVGVPIAHFLSDAIYKEMLDQVPHMLHDGGSCRGRISATLDNEFVPCEYRMFAMKSYGGFINIRKLSVPDVEQNTFDGNALWVDFGQPLLVVGDDGAVCDVNAAFRKWSGLDQDDLMDVKDISWLGDSFAEWMSSLAAGQPHEEYWRDEVCSAGSGESRDVIAMALENGAETFGFPDVSRVILFVDQKGDERCSNALNELLQTADIGVWELGQGASRLKLQGSPRLFKDLMHLSYLDKLRERMSARVWRDLLSEFVDSRRHRRVFCITLDGAWLVQDSKRSYVVYGQHQYRGNKWIGMQGIIHVVDRISAAADMHNKMFDVLCKHVPVGVFVRRMRDGMLMAWNAELCRVLGLKEDFATVQRVLTIHAVEMGIGSVKDFSETSSTMDYVKSLDLQPIGDVVDVRMRTINVQGGADSFVLGMVSPVAALSGGLWNHDMEEMAGSASQTLPDHQGQSRVVLVIDDDRAVRLVVQRMLEPEGYEVLLAEEYGKARDLAEIYGERICLIVLDMKVKGSAPRDVYESVVVRVGRRIPVIFFSGYCSPMLLRGQLGNIPGRIVEKPFTRDILIGAVNDLFGK